MIFYCRFLEAILKVCLFLENSPFHPDFQIYQHRAIRNLFVILKDSLTYPKYIFLFFTLLAFYVLPCLYTYFSFQLKAISSAFNSGYADIFQKPSSSFLLLSKSVLRRTVKMQKATAFTRAPALHLDPRAPVNSAFDID